MTDLLVHLRPFRETDLDLFARFATDRDFAGPFEWFGFRSAESFRRRWETDGFLGDDPHYLVVAQADEITVGWVMWRRGNLGAGGVWEIGALLAPEFRGRGAGTAAQRLLVEYLFATTTAHRIWAGTQLDNAAEQRALEKCGFRREGLLRESVFRGGKWRDSLVYGLLRDEALNLDDRPTHVGEQ